METVMDTAQLAHELVNKLLEVTGKFMEDYKTNDPAVVVGASNLYSAAILLRAPSKENALNVLNENFAILNKYITEMPDDLFGKPGETTPEK